MLKNKLLITGLLILLMLVGVYFFVSSRKVDSSQELYRQTLLISKQYISLRYRTDNLLIHAKNYPNYFTWNKEMIQILIEWKNLENDSQTLEKNAQIMEGKQISLHIISQAQAYDKQEISDIFDKAPAGKKIATLAKHLGVDAKRAYKILQQDQNQVTADAWNEAGDTFRKLETSATVIKDGCKIAGFVGGVVISGGTSAIAAGSTLAKASIIISGADLSLEVSEDAASIALGDGNKITAIVGSVRKITEPISTLLNINEIPNNLKTGFEKFEAVMVGIEQFRGAIQDGKIVGVALPVYTKDKTKPPIKVAILKKEEVNTWLSDKGTKPGIEDQETVEEILGISQPIKMITPLSIPNTPMASPSGVAQGLPAETWAGTLQNTSGGDGGVNYYDLKFSLNSDGTVTFISGFDDFEFLTWKQIGEAVRLYGEKPSAGYYEFKRQGNSLVLIKTVMFGTEYLAGGVGIMGGKEIEGTLVKQ